MAIEGADPVQHLQRFCHNLRADAVAPDYRNLLFHVRFHSFREASSPPFAMMFWINGGNGSA